MAAPSISFLLCTISRPQLSIGSEKVKQSHRLANWKQTQVPRLLDRQWSAEIISDQHTSAGGTAVGRVTILEWRL